MLFPISDRNNIENRELRDFACIWVLDTSSIVTLIIIIIMNFAI